MGQLIDDLLALARLGRKEMTLAAVDMDELVETLWQSSRPPSRKETCKSTSSRCPKPGG